MTELDSNNTCDESYTQCIPSLNLNNGTVHCNCEDCPTTSSTGMYVRCNLKRIEFSDTAGCFGWNAFTSTT